MTQYQNSSQTQELSPPIGEFISTIDYDNPCPPNFAPSPEQILEAHELGEQIIRNLKTDDCGDPRPSNFAPSPEQALEAHKTGEQIIRDLRTADRDVHPIPNLAGPEQVLAADKLGKRMIRNLKKGKATNLPHVSRRQQRIKPTFQARETHSHVAHGGARKTGDDGDGDEPPPKLFAAPSRRPNERARRTAIAPLAKRPARFFYPWIERDPDIRDNPFLSDLHAHLRENMPRAEYVRARREAAMEEEWERLMK